MKLIYPYLIVMFFICLLHSCKSKGVKYKKEDLYVMARKIDPSVSFVLPRGLADGVNCSDYPPGCVAGHIVEVQKLNLIAVEFLTEEQAKFAAKKLRGYSMGNWLLDDVKGEPVLEKFAEELLKAQRP